MKTIEQYIEDVDNGSPYGDFIRHLLVLEDKNAIRQESTGMLMEFSSIIDSHINTPKNKKIVSILKEVDKKITLELTQDYRTEVW